MAASMQSLLVRSASIRRSPRPLMVCPPRRSFLGVFKEYAFNMDTYLKMTQKISISEASVNKFIKKKNYEHMVKDQKFRPERLSALGPDLAAANFLVARGGAVKFIGKEYWAKKKGINLLKIPTKYDPDYKIEGIDCSDMRLIYCGLDNLADLEHLKYVNFSHGEFVDDWFLARLQTFKDTLEFLDISGCSRVTENGVLALHHLRNLKVLKMKNCEFVRNQELIAMLLEDTIPDLQVIGVNKSTDTIPDNIDISDRLKQDMKDLDFQTLQSRFLHMGDVLDEEGNVTSSGALKGHYDPDVDDMLRTDLDSHETDKNDSVFSKIWGKG